MNGSSRAGDSFFPSPPSLQDGGQKKFEKKSMIYDFIGPSPHAERAVASGEAPGGGDVMGRCCDINQAVLGTRRCWAVGAGGCWRVLAGRVVTSWGSVWGCVRHHGDLIRMGPLALAWGALGLKQDP